MPIVGPGLAPGSAGSPQQALPWLTLAHRAWGVLTRSLGLTPAQAPQPWPPQLGVCMGQGLCSLSPTVWGPHCLPPGGGVAVAVGEAAASWSPVRSREAGPPDSAGTLPPCPGVWVSQSLAEPPGQQGWLEAKDPVRLQDEQWLQVTLLWHPHAAEAECHRRAGTAGSHPLPGSPRSKTRAGCSEAEGRHGGARLHLSVRRASQEGRAPRPAWATWRAPASRKESLGCGSVGAPLGPAPVPKPRPEQNKQ